MPTSEHRMTLHSETASGGRRGWIKRITSVDRTRRNGYAFRGDFLHDGEHDLPLGAVLVECQPYGTVRQGCKRGIAWRVGAHGLEQLAVEEQWYRRFLTFRDAVAEALNTNTETSI